MRNTPLLAPALLFSAALLTLRPAIAATVTWDTSTAAGFQSGNGTWGTDNFWSTDGTTLLPWVSGDTASFLGQASAVTNTITVGSNQTIGGLNFGSAAASGNWTLSGSGALALSGNASFSVAAGSTAEIRSSLVLSSNTLTKTGAGTLVLNNPALISANISVDEGILRLKVPSTTTFYSGGNITVGNGAELAFAANDTFGIVGAGTAAAVVLNGGTLSSNGFFTTLNSLTLNGGTIKANGGPFPQFGAFQFFGTVSVTKDASIVQSGSNGNINLQNTIFNVSAGATLDSNATFLNNPANVLTGTLTKAGAGSLILNGASAYSAGTTITAGTLTVGNSSALGSGGVTVSGGTLNLASFSLANTITLSGGTLSGTQLDGSRLALQGGEVTGNIVSGAVTKTGVGTVTLRGANTYTGATTISAGTLTLASGATMGSGALVVSAGANLVLNANASTTALTGSGTVTIGSGAALTLSPPSGAPQFFGGFSGSGSLIKSGAGEALLAGDSSGFTGAVTLNGGILSAQNSISTLGSGDVTVTGNTTIATFLVGPTFVTPGRLNNRITVTSGTLSLGVNSQNQGQTIFGNDIIASGTGSISVGVGGNGTYVIEKDISNTGTGTVTVASGSTLQLGNGGATGTFNGGLAFNLSSAGRLAFKRSDNITYSGVLSGTGSLAQAGTGNLTLTGTNTYTGATTISAGTLTLASGATMGSGALVVSAGANLVLNANASTTALTGSGTVTIGSGAALTLSPPSGAPQFFGGFSGSGSLIKSGAGEALLAGDSSGFTGAVTLNGGILSAQNSISTLGSGDVTVTGNTTIATFLVGPTFVTPGRLNNRITVTSGTLSLGVNSQNQGQTIFGNDIIASGTGSISVGVGGNGTYVIEKDISNTGTGTVTVASGSTLQLGNGGATGTFNGGLAFNLSSAGRLAFKRSDNITYSGVLSGTGSLAQAGTGNLTLTGTNTYTGGTTVSAGTLTLASGGTLGTGAVAISDTGVVDLGGQTVANNWVVNGGTLRGGALDVAKLTASAGTISANLGGAGGFSKSGTGSVVLSGTNTYAGGTTLNGGTLTLGSGSALGTGAVALTSGTLNLNGQTIGNNLTLGAAVIDGSGTLSGVISGNAAFAKTGTTTLTFNGLNTYSGGTTVSAGTLIAGSNSALGSGAVAVAGGTLDLGTSALSNTITLSSGTLAGSQLNGDKLVLQGGEVTGVVSSGALSKTSSGTVTLSGANSYGGGTTVTAGTLVVNNADALGAGSVTLAGGSLDVQAHTVAKNITLTSNSAVAGANGTISGVISGSGLLTKVGSGALTLSGNNTFAGGALVNAGTLHVNGEVLGNLVVSSGAKLAGSGIVHDVTVVAGGSINAGGVDSVGTMRADSLSLQGGAKVELNLSDASLAAGNGFDRFLLTGQLDLSAASSANKYSLILAGLPSVFDAASDYSFAFIKYGSLNLGANTNISDLFTLDVSGLKDQTGGALDVSKFSLVDDVANQQVLLNYGSPIPEPSTYGLSLGCLGLAIAAGRRRRRMTV